MCKEIDNGLTRVVNNGVDVVVIVSSDAVVEALKASRTLAVKGISTAVIEVLTTEPLDKKTLIEYATKTGTMIFVEVWLYEKVKVSGLLNQYLPVIEVIEESTAESIIQTAQIVAKLKTQNI